MIKQIKHLINQLDPDLTLLKWKLVIIAFSSNNYLVDMHENICKDILMFGTFRRSRSPNIYVELIWKYMLYRYSYYESVLRFAGLVKYVLDKIRQTASIDMNNDNHHNFVDETTEKIKEALIIDRNEPILL